MPGALAGRSIWDDELPASAAAVADGHNDRCELEQPLHRHDGTLRWFRLVLVLIRDGAGRPEHLTVMLEDIDARKRTEAELIHRSSHDALTSLPTRSHFLERLREARGNALRSRTQASVSCSSTSTASSRSTTPSGHHAGDELLIAIAGRLAQRTAARRPRRPIRRRRVRRARGRHRRHTRRDSARVAARERVPDAVHRRRQHESRVTASFGVCFSSDHDEADEDLVRKADAAMYTAKQRGRNRVAVFGDAAGVDALASGG